MPHSPNKSSRANSSPITRGATSKKASFRKRAETAPLWDNVPKEAVYVLVCATATSNAPATLSYTRDGTALVSSIYYDGERYVDYLADQAEFEAYLQWVLEELLDLAPQELASYRAMLP